MTSPSKSTKDWEKISDEMFERTENANKGVNNADVDWFLRDSNVSLADTPALSLSNIGANATDGKELKPQIGSLIHTSSSPLLPVLNAHETNMNKAKASVSSILEEEAHTNTIQDYSIEAGSPRHNNRKNSVSSIGSASSIDSSSSAGGFFSKLKNRLQRSDSLGSTQSFVDTASLYHHKKHSHPLILSMPESMPNNCVSDSSAVEFRAPVSNPDSEIDDPHLQEYIQFFRQDHKRNSCLKHQLTYKNTQQLKHPDHHCDTPHQPSKFSSFFRKMSVSSHPQKREEPIPSGDSSLESVTSSDTHCGSEEFLPELSNLKPLRHVAFHSQTFLIDPPQQIPSRNPRKGNVEILPSGVVRINPLTEADKVAIEKSLKGQGGGLVVGGTGVLGLAEKDSETIEIDSHEFSSNETSNNEEKDVKVDEHARSLGIEKPMMHLSRKTGYTVPVKKMPLDLMYTRCCHLREILAVPAILKQIPQGSTAPLPILQLRNPNPTMIEIQTFADFIRIAPIIWISLDGVSLSIEQFSILLSAMCAKTQLEKLSLRNTPIDTKGWILLCWFLSRNRVINKLDITQCPPLSLNLLKKKKKPNLDRNSFARMICNRENRSDMDWPLFTAALIARGGIEELILTGCCITDLSVFKSLISKAVTIRTFKLGLAYNQISPQQLDCVLKYWVFSDNCRGLDLGYNDLLSSRYLKIFLNHGRVEGARTMVSKSQIWFLSLNATNLRFDKTFQDFFENFIVQLPKLRYLDMSNNPKLFGTHLISFQHTSMISGNATGSEFSSESINTFFCSKLPRFNNLARLHLENNEISSQNLKSLFEIIPFCKSLNYLSIIGNHLDIYSATSLLQCLRYSTSLITVDADYLDLPEILKEKVGLYSMRNMHQIFNQNINKECNSGTGTTGSNTLTTSLADELNQLLSRRTEEKLDFESPEVKNVVKKIQHHRSVLQDAFADLFDLQYRRELSVEGKETLIKLLFVDSALKWALKLVDSSFIEKDESLSSSDIINMNSAENGRNETKSSMLSKARESFLVEQTALSPVDLGSLQVSRQQSLTNLASLNKEEGSAMKLLRIGDQAIFQDLNSASGEQIRQKLLSANLSDLDTVIDNISKARDKGIAMKEIFNTSINKKLDAEASDDTKQVLDKPTPGASTNTPTENMKLLNNVSSGSAGEELSINETYDEILREFNK
ncbi:RNI-like protein [Metschnikowia bicuspidata var. bicuspidata NRRL YB-4993]|uniref:RNI-like protein n=1 Tax=Metschnikowia bicuspidata var. bicuspidata NRRL YB-4993 TaxID=869754 RepID=A0A1A0HDW5_9ASCO|nr:RNI-like protein [Metschnikowia bicuspidata var. bicuspidata NRRL YB-4993]OBA22201.1 RNI-like protein [Metschnikowia bicuspidata var. bicuspidata NRRL YB-4993]